MFLFENRRLSDEIFFELCCNKNITKCMNFYWTILKVSRLYKISTRNIVHTSKWIGLKEKKKEREKWIGFVSNPLANFRMLKHWILNKWQNLRMLKHWILSKWQNEILLFLFKWPFPYLTGNSKFLLKRIITKNLGK